MYNGKACKSALDAIRRVVTRSGQRIAVQGQAATSFELVGAMAVHAKATGLNNLEVTHLESF